MMGREPEDALDDSLKSPEELGVPTPEPSNTTLGGGAADRASEAVDESGSSGSEDSDSRIDFDAFRKDVKQEGSVKVGGETVKDYSEGVQTKGPVDATDPTSIEEADRDQLTAAGYDESGEKNTSETVDQFVSERNEEDTTDMANVDTSGGSGGDDAGPVESASAWANLGTDALGDGGTLAVVAAAIGGLLIIGGN